MSKLLARQVWRRNSEKFKLPKQKPNYAPDRFYTDTFKRDYLVTEEEEEESAMI